MVQNTLVFFSFWLLTLIARCFSDTFEAIFGLVSRAFSVIVSMETVFLWRIALKPV